MLTTTPSDERWLAVLEGRAAPTDLAERQAAELRSYFEQGLLATPAVDAQQEKRMMNALRARGAFAEAPQPQQGLLAALKAWWQAPQGRMGYGYSAAAVLAFALVSVPLLQQPPEGDLGDEAQPMQPVPQPKGQPKSFPKTPAVAVVVAADPAEASLRLQLLLSAQGIASAMQPDGAGWRLTAELPAEARDALAPEFQARGLAWPADGRLDVRFTRQR